MSSPRPAAPAITLRTADGRQFRFTETFSVGRGSDCDVAIDDSHVSRTHISVAVEQGRWCVSDLKSSNGVFVEGRRVLTAAIDGRTIVRLGGVDGPPLVLEPETGHAVAPSRPDPGAAGGHADARILANYADRYFSSKETDGPVGERTMLIRKAFESVQKKQKRRYGWIVGVLALIAIGAGVYAYRSSRQLAQQKAVAEELFYQIKSLDVRFANDELQVAAGSQRDQGQVRQYLENRRKLEDDYDQFLSSTKLYGSNLTEEERLILRVTRAFGECDLVAPRDYLTEVSRYIQKWKSTGRFERAARLAQSKGYTRKIAQELIAQHLPPEFFYLAMQESDFEPFRAGPQTPYGFAKGMWQFIPDTGARYGLKPGPLAGSQRPDPGDDRSDWEKATKAAARYIKDIYATDAQASGLLVMASYNWGERRVINRIKQMPNNPKERNFWKLLENYRRDVPNQTYDYVFYIVSAAVVGQNPRLFGIELDNPLAAAARP